MIVFFYTIGALTCFAWGTVNYVDGTTWGDDEEKRRGARLLLTWPVWPLALLLMFGGRIGREIGEVWKAATRR